MIITPAPPAIPTTIRNGKGVPSVPVGIELVVVVVVVVGLGSGKTSAKSNESATDPIYERHKVDVVGFWVNAEAEEEFIYMSRYDDEADYKNKVALLQKDEDYIRLGAKVKEARMDSSKTRLVPKWVPS